MPGAVKLNTAGGGSVVVQPASSIASDVTVNVPSVNGTLVSTGSTAQVSQAMLASGVAGTGPAFYATVGTNQSLSSATVTKLQFNTETFDTASCYDTSNYRFTPNVAGYYQINLSEEFGPQTGVQAVSIYKNGARVASGGSYANNSGTFMASASTVIYLNGSTDYVEAYGYVSQSALAYNNSSSQFSGALVRAA